LLRQGKTGKSGDKQGQHDTRSLTPMTPLERVSQSHVRGCSRAGHRLVATLGKRTGGVKSVQRGVLSKRIGYGLGAGR
jgi:hypothetical protein